MTGAETAVVEPVTFRRRLARSWAVTYPLIVGSLSTVALSVVDTAILGRYSTQALAVIALVAPLFVFASSLVVPWGTAVQVLVARWSGARDHARIARVLDVGLLVCLTIGLAGGGVLAAVAVPLVRLVADGQPPPGAAGVLAILAAALPFIAVTTHYRGVFGGLGQTRVAMRVALLVNLTNIPLDYVFVFVADLGATGSALGTVLATVTGAGYLTWASRRGLGTGYPFWRRANLRRAREIAGPLWTIGWPDVAFAALVYGADVLLVRVVAGLGQEEPLAGYRLMVTTITIIWVAVFGCSSGIAILAGQRLGAGDPAAALGYARSGGTLMAVLALVAAVPALLVPNPFFGLFSPDAVVVAEAAGAAPLLLVVVPAMIVSMTLAGVLRAAGDTKSILYAGAISQFVLAVPLAWVAAVWLGWGLAGVYTGFAGGLLARAAFTWLRFRRGRWREPAVPGH